MCPSLIIETTPAMSSVFSGYQSDLKKSVPAEHAKKLEQAKSLISSWEGIRINEDDRTFGEIFRATIDASEQKDVLRDALSFFLFRESLSITQENMTGRYFNTIEYNSRDGKNELLVQQKKEFNAKRAIAGLLILLDLTKNKEPTGNGDTIFSRPKDELYQISSETVRKAGIELDNAVELQDKPVTKDILKSLIEDELENSDATNFMEFLRMIVYQKRKEFMEAVNAQPIQFMSAIYSEVSKYCENHNLVNPLLDLTIGDVEPQSMPIEVREAMGLDPTGPKGLMIERTAQTRMALAESPTRYDVPSLGKQELRDCFVRLGKEWHLYDDNEIVDPAGSMMGEGGLGVFPGALRAAKEYVKSKIFTKGQKGVVSAYFPDPAFRMVANTAAGTGVKIIEKPTFWEDDYLPDAGEVDDYLAKHDNCKIFILTPINNPGSTVAAAAKVRKLLEILRRHNVVLVTDLAYIGTGDPELNFEVMNEIKQYKNRIDIFSMSKIFGQPGLRVGCAVTPNKDLAVIKIHNPGKDDTTRKLFIEAVQLQKIGISYESQFKALAIWDLVTPDDRRLLAEYYHNKQDQLKKYLADIDERRATRGLPPLKNPERKILGDAALYLVYPMNDITIDQANGKRIDLEESDKNLKLDAFELISQAFVITTPFRGFYRKGKRVYKDENDGSNVRMSIGVARIPA